MDNEYTEGTEYAAEPCRWEYDEKEDRYETGCHGAYSIAEGTPEQNGMSYCPYCGRPLLAAG